MAESFFARLGFKLVGRRIFVSRQMARTVIFGYVEVFYNRQRVHQTRGYRMQLEVEEVHQTGASLTCPWMLGQLNLNPVSQSF